MIPQADLDVWLAKMRHLKSKKHQGSLEKAHHPEHRCCLGHACAAFGVDRLSERENSGVVSYGSRDEGWHSKVLPVELVRRLRIKNNGEFKKPITIKGYRTEFDRPVEFGSLVEINDNTRLSLAQIADIIERENKADNFEEPEMLEETE